MGMMDFDVVIVGQGLAGTALAWQLHLHGMTFCIVDREHGVTASTVGAGLITPITGQRFVRTDEYPHHWQAAQTHYQHVERLIGHRVLDQNPSMRIFQSASDVQQFERRRAQFEDAVADAPKQALASFNAPFGGFFMHPAGRLHAKPYLSASREFFRHHASYRMADMEPRRDVRSDAAGVSVSVGAQQVTAKWLVFCQGFCGRSNPWFPGVPDKPVRGDILRVRVDGLEADHVVHGRVWMAPQHDGSFLTGSTHDWNNLSNEPDDAGRQQILDRLAKMIRDPVRVQSHAAAVRPATSDRRPVVGFHPEARRIGVFNGLGGRGALLAPWCAALLVRSLQTDSETYIPEELHCGRFCAPPLVASGSSSHERESTRRLTSRVHDFVKQHVTEGDCAIDATAGNGHDTLFLARRIGPSGRIISIDLQSEAVEQTRKRLREANQSNAIVIQDNHVRLTQIAAEHDLKSVQVIMFNLGYRPGGNRKVITETSTTLPALQQAVDLVTVGGAVSVVAYRGHDGGQQEFSTVRSFFEQIDPERFSVRRQNAAADDDLSPVFFLAIRR